jgi:hypothetical protein
MFAHRTLLALTLLPLAGACRSEAPELSGRPGAARDSVVLPAEMVAHRFFVHPITRAGDTLTLYTDTGGGLFLLADAAERLGLERDSAGTVALPAFREGAWIPDPQDVDDTRLPLLEERGGGPDVGDGMLGQAWFADRVWTFDYGAGRLLLREGGARPTTGVDSAHRVELAFKTDATGVRVLSFPRIRIAVDGDSLDVLFDTGAMVRLTEGAHTALGGDGPEVRATSFITTSVLEGWLARHPDWSVLEDADGNLPGMRMVEVPRVSVAGWDVGPVWFTERPDRNFHEYMAQFMDRGVEGALGGSALRWFRVTVDYPLGRADFERVGR